MIDTADTQLKAMILFGINGGMGNTDCSSLPLSALDLNGGWLNYPRPKTGVDRRIPLDILLKDPQDDTMFEVEVMLGETDETHIIRTIEYWDNEKRRWPQPLDGKSSLSFFEILPVNTPS